MIQLREIVTKSNVTQVSVKQYHIHVETGLPTTVTQNITMLFKMETWPLSTIDVHQKVALNLYEQDARNAVQAHPHLMRMAIADRTFSKDALLTKTKPNVLNKYVVPQLTLVYVMRQICVIEKTIAHITTVLIICQLQQPNILLMGPFFVNHFQATVIK